jgi:hypothetical protein
MVTKISGIDEIPAIMKKEFKYKQGDEDYVLEFTPLTAEQVDEIRARIPAPVPPLQDIKGFTARELQDRKTRGLAIKSPNTDDPDYVVANQKYNDDVALAMVQTALGWTSVSSEDFAKGLKSKLPQGAYARLITEVNASTFGLDNDVMSRFLESLLPVQGTVEPS